MSTFFKFCPPELYDTRNGGNRADSLNYLKLINGSEIFWMHLDDADEGTVRGLEVNSVVIDQAEEVSENVFDHLRARIGRWDVAEVPTSLLDADPNWPRNPETNRPLAPAYTMILCNPDSELHWIYRQYHPDSPEFQEKYSHNHEMVQASSTENPTLDRETLADMMANDPIWVQRFVFGKWGIPGGAIHEVNDYSILEIDPNGIGQYDKERKAVLTPPSFLENLKRSAAIYRILDHGDASPTSCLWIASWKQHFFVFREYYKAGALISEHRKTINEMSTEPVRCTWADPSVFKKAQQKYGGFWSVADEYLDQRINEKSLALIPADNNELSTRNRLNEYLKIDTSVTHPVTGAVGAPRLYFIKRSSLVPDGCYYGLTELKSQRRKQLGTLNGKPVFSDERDETISDHSYDCIRYFVAMHPYWNKVMKINAPTGSFFDVKRQIKILKTAKQDLIPLGSY